MYDEKVNTLELRIPIIINTNKEIETSNPEFQTKTRLFNLDEVENLKTVPALKELINQYTQINTAK